jgi:hypothetical protein
MKNYEYYTPDTDEFCIGFEYEYKTWKGFVGKKVDNFDHRSNMTMSLHYDLSLNRDKYRVRKLHYDDFMSLGFDVGVTIGDGYLNEFINKNVYIDHEPSTGHVNIWVFLDGVKRSFFSGFLRNKTELNNVLKLIRYEELINMQEDTLHEEEQ